MNRDEALESGTAKLEAIAECCRKAYENGYNAALSSCACGGREDLWGGVVEVVDVRGSKAYVETVYITIAGQDLKVGDKLHVYAFLPAEGV